jgi:hypothetical protein
MATQADKPVETKSTHNHYSTFSNRPGWLYGLVGLVVLILVFMAGAGIANHRHGDMGFKSSGVARAPGGFGGGRRFGGAGQGTVTINGQTRTSGVVASVNGSSFTLAGHGSATNVTTSGSTQYQGGNQVKQNDSVTVFGTTSNGTLSATQIVINP